MIIWRGWGVLALIIPVAAWLGVPELFKALLAPATYSASFKAISGSSILVGAAAVWWLGRTLNRRGAEGGGHSLFFVAMEYWAVPFALLGLATLFR